MSLSIPPLCPGRGGGGGDAPREIGEQRGWETPGSVGTQTVPASPAVCPQMSHIWGWRSAGVEGMKEREALGCCAVPTISRGEIWEKMNRDVPACSRVPCNAFTLLALSPTPGAPQVKLGLFPARCWFV